jgi:hypothetical protein
MGSHDGSMVKKNNSLVDGLELEKVLATLQKEPNIQPKGWIH